MKKSSYCGVGDCVEARQKFSPYCSEHVKKKDEGYEWAKDNQAPSECGALGSQPHLFEKGQKSDPVHHPAHYNSGRFEVAEVIEDWKLDFRTGNSVKYIARAGKKDPLKYVEDLEKAIWYLKRAIYVYRAEHEQIDRVKPDEMK